MGVGVENRVDREAQVTPAAQRQNGEQMTALDQLERDAERIRYGEALDRLRAAAPLLLAALRSVEWCRAFNDDEYWCPRCGRDHIAGHTPNCQLAAAIRAAEGKDQ